MQTIAEGLSKPLRALLWSAALLSLALLVRFWVAADRGIDLTDEGFYLVAIEAPRRYDFFASLSGFALHPFYAAVGGDIVSLRRLNLLLTFGLALFFFGELLRAAAVPITGRERLLALTALASTSMVLFCGWLLTPFYNSIALQGLLIAATCLLRLKDRETLPRLAGIGLGGWVVFLAKPPAAVLLAGLVTVVIWVVAKRPWRSLLTAAGVALLLLALTAFWIDGGPVAFAERLRRGAAFSTLDHHVADLFWIGIPGLFPRELLAFGLLVALGAAPALLRRRFAGHGRLTLLPFVALLVWALLALALGDSLRVMQSTTKAAIMLAPLVICAVWAWESGSTSRRRWGPEPAGTTLNILLLALLLLPVVYAFGTRTQWWELGSKAGSFWVAAAILWAVRSGPTAVRQERFVVLTLVSVATACTVSMSAMLWPYRLTGPISAQTEVVQIGGSELKLSPQTAAYVGAAMAESRAAGLKEGTFVMDLTGSSPGLVYVIGGASRGLPWFIGGRPASDKTIERLFRQLSCETLASGWLLVEPDGSRSLDESRLLRSMGAELSSDYESVARLLGAPTNGRRRPRGALVIYRPTRPAELAVRACAEARQAESGR